MIVIDIETTGRDAHRDELLCVGLGRRVHPPEVGRRMAADVLSRPGVVVCHTNYDLRWLMLEGIALGPETEYHDTKVMAWMLDATQPLDLASLTRRYLGIDTVKPIRRVAGRIMFESKAGLVPIEDVPFGELAAYNAADLAEEAELYGALKKRLMSADLWRHFVVEEAPFSRLLVEMECAGMPFDVSAASRMHEETTASMETQTRRLRASITPDFNPASTEQVARYVYTDTWPQEIRFPIPRLRGMSKEQKLLAVQKIAPQGVEVSRVGREYAYGTMTLKGLGLPRPGKDRKAKTPRPTVSSKVLSIMHAGHPWVDDYIEWRRLSKLEGYLRDWIDREHHGRLYGRFDQSGTITGRLSGREPNLQQVSKTADVRDLFRGDLVIGDFAGLEARIAAHFSQDPVMLDIFNSGHDLYGTLAARAWGGPADKSNEGRGLMKVLQLATSYGAGSKQVAFLLALAGLREQAGEARALLADLKRTLPRLFEWRDEVIAQAQADGYVETLAGRRRQMAGMDSAGWEKKSRAERQAVNSKVQGSAADIVRRAMLRARRVCEPDEARMILQVHDEILWERGPDWEDDVFDRLVAACESHELSVPLVFEAKVATSWADKGGDGGSVEAGAYAHLSGRTT